MSTRPPSKPRLAFVDLETTGGTMASDRITEVGIIEVDEDGVREWSSLVNPHIPIPPFIQSLTGISNDMVRDAPSFEDIADDIHARLHDRIFVAHNARFDHGFLKQAFSRTGHQFQPSVLCTVRLSRKLYPQYEKHNLDALTQRHRLHVSERHRALGDAQLIWQFWQRVQQEHPAADIEQAVAKLTKRPSLPSRLDPAVLDSLPSTHGVYLFLGQTDLPLYIGKANNLRRRVLSHFSGDHLSDREMALSQQTERLEWINTAGELGALLVEANLIKLRMPAENRQLRANEDLCSWRFLPRRPKKRSQAQVDAHLHGGFNAGLEPLLARPDDLFFAHDPQLYGLFNTPRAANAALRAIVDANALCPVMLGLEKGQPGQPCFASQIDKCAGACRGKESITAHDQRLLEAMETVRLQAWPYAGPIAIQEGEDWHVIDAWAYLGTARSRDEIAALATHGQHRFDRDVYQILQKWLPKVGPRIEQLRA